MDTPLSTAFTVIRHHVTPQPAAPDYANGDVVQRALAVGSERDRYADERRVAGLLPQADTNPISTVFEVATNVRVQALNLGRTNR